VLSIEENVEHQSVTAAGKAGMLASPATFLVRTMLAGAYIGIGVLIMTTASGPLVAAHHPFAALVSGAVFGIALTIVVVAGGELATSSMMYLTHGAMLRTITWGRAGWTLLATLGGNLLGAMVFALLVHLSGVEAQGTAAGDMLAGMIEHKAAETTVQLVVRGMLCNLMVCLAVWCANKLTNEAAKILVIFCCVLVFITSGFEHVVANMTTFSLGLFMGLPGATTGEFARNVVAVGIGNTLGGGLLVAAAYAVGSRPARATDSAEA